VVEEIQSVALWIDQSDPVSVYTRSPLFAGHGPGISGMRRARERSRYNELWRTCFRFVDADADDVEITDYH